MITILLPLYHTHRISIETWMLHLPGPRLATWSSPPSSAPASAAPSGAGTSGAACGFGARSLENRGFHQWIPQMGGL